jgi:hypothetical protein
MVAASLLVATQVRVPESLHHQGLRVKAKQSQQLSVHLVIQTRQLAIASAVAPPVLNLASQARHR